MKISARNWIPLVLATALAAAAPAQSPQPFAESAVRVPGGVKYAGRYDVTTGTWSRGKVDQASRGTADTIYSNTALSGYFSTTVGPTGAAAFGSILDAAQIPSTSSPVPFQLGGAGRDASVVGVVTIGYCDLDTTPGVAGFEVSFYDSYSPCTFPPDPAEFVGDQSVVGAPANGCWIVDLDGLGFVLQHDGDGTHDGDPTLDSFGVAWRYTGTGSAEAGLLVAGDPLNTDSSWVAGNPPRAGSNTYYGDVSNCFGFGSGFENGDSYWVEDSGGVGGLPAGSNCYFFGGYQNAGSACGGPLRAPYGAYALEMTAALCLCSQTISTVGCFGFPNATGEPGQVRVDGNAQASANDARIIASNLPPQQFGIFATGLVPIAPGTINSGNGTLCIDPGGMGGLGRFAGPGQIKNSGLLGEFSLDTSAGEWDLSMIPTSTGTYAAVSGLTNYFQAWHREPVGAGFNFTGSCSVWWQ